jgi:hypothetical protein
VPPPAPRRIPAPPAAPPKPAPAVKPASPPPTPPNPAAPPEWRTVSDQHPDFLNPKQLSGAPAQVPQVSDAPVNVGEVWNTSRDDLDEVGRALFPDSAQSLLARVRGTPLLGRIKQPDAVPAPLYLPPNTPKRYPTSVPPAPAVTPPVSAAPGGVPHFMDTQARLQQLRDAQAANPYAQMPGAIKMAPPRQ